MKYEHEAEIAFSTSLHLTPRERGRAPLSSLSSFHIHPSAGSSRAVADMPGQHMLRLVALLTSVSATFAMAIYRRRLHRALDAAAAAQAALLDPSRCQTPVLRKRGTVLVRPTSSKANWTAAARITAPPQLSVAAAEDDASAMGILVHGCHLEAESWDDIVWGLPPNQLGRLPHAALLAWEERAHVKRVICGTGASKASDGRLEGQYTVDVLV